MSMSMMEIEKTLKQLRLSGVRATLETRLIESQASSLSFLETFSALLQDELDRRQSRLLERRYQLSGLEERASLAEFDWGYNPKIPKRTCFELHTLKSVSYTHLRAHETVLDLVCRLLLEKKHRAHPIPSSPQEYATSKNI